jgi:hypothetical protein
MSNDDRQSETVGASYQTEQSAITIFRGLLPQRWIPRKLDPDFHVDFLVETVESGQLTGVHLGVQLKGWQPKKNYKGRPKYSLKTKHLAYYVDKCLFPVFLVLVDVSKKTAYWVFMQQFAKQLATSWRGQEKIVVRFPEKATLADQAQFITSVQCAEQYTRDLHPGTVKAALRQTKAMLEAQDKRVRVEVDIVGGKEHVTIYAKEDFSFKFNIKADSEEKAKAFIDFVEKGSDLKINAKDLEITGAPVLQHLMGQENELLLQFRAKVPGHVVLSWNDSDAFSQVQVPASFWSGTKYMCCEAELPNAPLKLAATICPNRWNNQDPFSLEFHFQVHRWERQPLAILPYFEPLNGFIQAIVAKQPITLRFYIQGNLFGEAKASGLNPPGIEQMFQFLDCIRKARMLAEHFQQHIVLPPLTETKIPELEPIHELYGLIFERGYRKRVGEVRLERKLSEPLSLDPEPDGTFNQTLISPNAEYFILKHLLSAGPVALHFSKLNLVEHVEGIKARFVGTKDSEMFVQLSSESNLQS